MNGDGITDPLLEIESSCSWRDENASTYRTYYMGKLILVNGKDGSEIGDAETMADEYIWFYEWCWYDFNNDGIFDFESNSTYSKSCSVCRVAATALIIRSIQPTLLSTIHTDIVFCLVCKPKIGSAGISPFSDNEKVQYSVLVLMWNMCYLPG